LAIKIATLAKIFNFSFWVKTKVRMPVDATHLFVSYPLAIVTERRYVNKLKICHFATKIIYCVGMEVCQFDSSKFSKIATLAKKTHHFGAIF